ncbi:MAG: hypothetical protein P4M09_04620 [Devosia sp.]|nr:hypothetical protein [Devosia sp.]
MLASGAVASAGSPINSTNLTFDPGHGTQVEYLSDGGGAYLWYPGNSIILPGHWKMQGGSTKHPAQICFRYGPNTYNPVTHVYGDKWECEGVDVYTSYLTEQAKGDVLGLAHRSAAPFTLSRSRVTLEQLAKQTGQQANLGQTVTPPKSAPAPVTAASAKSTCDAITAKANTSRGAMIEAALTYYHGEYMGQHCLTVDYAKAFALLKQAGDTADYASLLANLKGRAATGNPKAIAALDSMGLR